MFSSLLSTLTTTRVSPSSWDPSSTLPNGSTSIVETFRAPASPSSTVALLAHVGAWSHGTVAFTVAKSSSSGSSPYGGYNPPAPSASGPSSGGERPKAGDDGPPSYEAAVGQVAVAAQVEKERSSQQLEAGGGYVEVRVESRWNDESLWDATKVDLVQTVRGVQLVIETPVMSPSRLGSQLSFHVTFSFPEELTTLAGLSTRGAQWRTLGDASLGKLPIAEVDINTANALIEFNKLKASKLKLETVNGPVRGDFDVETCEVKTGNGPIEANVTARAEAKAKTSNGPISGTWIGSPLSLETSNGKITGTFSSLSTSTPLRLATHNGLVSGTFTGLGGIHATTSNTAIEGTYKVGRKLELKTSNSQVKGKVTLLAEEAWKEPLERLAAGAGEGGAGGQVEVDVRTSNAKISLEFVKPKPTIQVLAVAKTSNAAIDLVWSGAYSGKVALSTSNAAADLQLPFAHKATYTSEEKSKKHAQVESGVEGVESSFEAGSSNAAVKFTVSG